MSTIHHNFILFAHPRSGSSNLLKALQLHPFLHIIEEPFHPKYKQWNPKEPDYYRLIKDRSSLDKHLAYIYSRYNGIKVLDYQLSKDLYSHLLLKPSLKVLHLQRQNMLQAIVSGFIAEQTGIWKKWDINEENARSFEKLKPISLKELEQRLNYVLELSSYYKDILSKKDSTMIHNLEYETLYSNDVEKSYAKLKAVYAFLGVNEQKVALEKLRYFIDPAISKINSRSTYDLLPNAREINERFGNEKTGWLYSPNLQTPSSNK